MITVVERKSGQQFESKKLASEYFKIPLWLVNKSITGNVQVQYRHDIPNREPVIRKYFFVQKSYSDGGTKVFKRKPTMPFGKYKGKEPHQVPLGYLIWLAKKDNCPQCVLTALKEVKDLLS